MIRVSWWRTRWRARLKPNLICWLLLSLLPARLDAQASQLDTVGGQVANAAGAPVSSATVLVTPLPTANTATATTDANGRFLLTFTRASTQRYLMVVRATGFVEYRRSLPVDSVSANLAIRLVSTNAATTTLEAVRVTASRDRPPRAYGFDGVSNPLELNLPLIGGVRGLLSPADEGDLARLVQLLPGIFDNGLGAFGLPGEQTLVTLNGATTDGVIKLPLGVASSVQDNTFSSGGAMGGVAGSNVNIRVLPGSALHYSSLSIYGDEIALNRTNAASVGGQSGRYHVSVAGHGPIGNSRLRYNGALSIGTSLSPSGVATSPELYRSLGVSPDSVQRVTDALAATGLSSAFNGRGAASQDIRAMVRIDRVPLPTRDDSSSRQISTIAQLNVSGDSPSPGAFSASTRMLTSRFASGQALVRVSEYVGRDHAWLHESQASIRGSNVRTMSAQDGVGGSIRVLSDDGGALGGRLFSFGATGSGPSSTQTLAAEVQSRFVRYWQRGRLESATIDISVAGTRRSTDDRANAYGQLYFASIGDFEAGNASRYSRALTSGTTGNDDAFASVSFTSVTWPSPRWRLASALRLDAERLSTRSMFHERAGGNPATSDHSRILKQGVLSPRVTLTYHDGARISREDPTRALRGGVPLYQGSVWQHIQFFRRWTFEFARLTSSLQNAVATTSERTTGVLECSGDAVAVLPPTIWQHPESASMLCDEPTSTGVISRRLVDTFRSPDSWMVALTRERNAPIIGGSFRLSVMQRYTGNLPSVTDANLDVANSFVDADGRIVFAAPVDIDERTGVIPLSASRNSVTPSRLLLSSSNGSVSLSRIGIDYIPGFSIAQRLKGTLLLSYAFLSGHEKRNGTSLLLGSDPAVIRRQPTTQPQHQVSARFAKEIGSFAVSGMLLARSGYRYSPIVGADVNGDGWVNDLARLAVDNSAVRQELHALRERTSRGARHCVDRVLDGDGAAFACRSPASLATSFTLHYLRSLPIGDRSAKLSLHVANPLAMLDVMLHGTDNLRGWGGFPVPDPLLLHVRGFDQQEKRFDYAVNSRFGQSIPVQATPFRLTLTARIDLADPIPVQQARELLSIRVRGQRELAPDNVVAQRLRNEYLFTTPYYGVLARVDSLALSAEQYSVIRDADLEYRTTTDSLFNSFAIELKQLERNGAQLVARKELQQRTYRGLYARELRKIYQVLRPEQVQKLNESLRVEILRAVDENQQDR